MPTFLDFIGYKGNFSSFGKSLLKDNQKTAILIEPSTITLLDEDGYIQSNLKRVIDFNTTKKDKMHKKLKANFQLINRLIKNNKWAI